MLRRLLVPTLAVVTFAASAPAHAAAPVKLYLNQLNASCQSGPQWALTTTAEDPGGCVYIPRVLVMGTGVDSDSESFVTSSKGKLMRIDAKKPVTGRFQLFGSSGLRPADGIGLVSADLTVKIAKKTIGVVHIEGPAAPTMPATKDFSLKIPAALNNVKTNKISVDVTWITCTGACGVKVTGASYLNVPVR